MHFPFFLSQVGSLGNDCADAGGHYNPLNVKHGRPGTGTDKRHAGDFGNVAADADGTAGVSLVMNDTRLADLVGRAVVVHEKEDTWGQPTGAAGRRLGCCVIREVASGAGLVHQRHLLATTGIVLMAVEIVARFLF